MAGDKAAGAEFNTKHRLSVIINSVQLLVTGATLVYWAWN